MGKKICKSNKNHMDPTFICFLHLFIKFQTLSSYENNSSLFLEKRDKKNFSAELTQTNNDDNDKIPSKYENCYLCLANFFFFFCFHFTQIKKFEFQHHRTFKSLYIKKNLIQ